MGGANYTCLCNVQDLRHRRSEVTVELRKVSASVLPVEHSDMTRHFTLHTALHNISFDCFSLYPLSLSLPPLRPCFHHVCSPIIQSRKEEEMRKRRNIPADGEDYTSQLGSTFTLENLVTKAQSSNPDEQFAAVQASRFVSSPCFHLLSPLLLSLPKCPPLSLFFFHRKILSKDKNPPIDEIIK